MKTRAAVAFEAKKPLEIVELDLEGPKAGEVLVEIMATGICHTDAYTLDGLDSEGIFPSVLGHEGAGIVREIGAGVTSVAVGDHVIPLYTPECRQCKSCLSGKTNLCTAIRATQGKGVMPDGTSRFSYKGQTIFHYMGCSTFSNFTVLPEIAVAKIRTDAPFQTSCYIGCGVTTGVGAVVNTAEVAPGDNVIVFGLGGIGLNVLQGARMAGANMIVGVDINPDREEWGKKFGMTHFVNPKDIDGDIVAHLVALTDGGADYTFDCTGNTTVMRQALEACHRGWGTSIIIGVAEAGKEISTRPFQLVTGRNWRGTAFGGAKGRTDVPKIVDWYMNGKIEIDPMITHVLTLDEINRGFDLMHAGESIRSVVVFEGESKMYSHMMVGSNDIERSKEFYDALFTTIGGKPGMKDPKGRLIYAKDGAMFLVTPPIDGQPATHGNGCTIGFAMTPEQADAWYEAGVAAGGTAIEDPPGPRQGGGMHLYLAYLRDPDGNKLCALHNLGA